MTSYELAQVNIARLKFPLDSPELKYFVDNLDPVNAAAESSDGFVWRLKDEESTEGGEGGEGGDATGIRIFGDEWLIVNMSVWRDYEALKTFMYQGTHRELLARRHEWFARVREAMTTLWWVPAGYRPTVTDAEERLVRLRTEGPTREAFTLTRMFPAP
ncbi:DUF3291 domain-containing protein [Streptomyces qinzhouensis]|uniref:DUF3291 domain-containing protein n=1 Tax=Streptomyces qinzhouensis TaxID=2599401 RepID=A0A5B8JFE6_9ACTN|nr:DUF3291 domain-containing protein [Streptomyces qinzhouensis]QDY79004.1 DUF3291 domain-containing protein [Streptomyces qinzhouensis]